MMEVLRDPSRSLFTSTIAILVVFNMCLVVVNANLSTSTYMFWGANRGKFIDPDTAQLFLDKSGGSAITSKASFLYGSIQMRIKLVSGNSAGTVTAFYLSSIGNKHDEIDFEFLGNTAGKFYTVHTNIFTQGVGNREQQFHLWFDPTTDFHTYTIFWNPYAVVWMIDDIPIRVFRNYHDTHINFPDSQAMNVFGSLWDAEQWATNGGRIKTDWSLIPFKAYMQGLQTRACFWEGTQSIAKCANKNNSANWWANSAFFKLNSKQLGQMNWVGKNYMIYDYCKDFKRFKGKMPKECSLGQF